MQKNTAVIRLDAIRHNAEIFSGLAGVKKLCAVVKADAYGHGAAAVAQTLHKAADFLRYLWWKKVRSFVMRGR